MNTVTIYDHGSAGFRVAIGEHTPHQGSKAATVRVYEDAELASAATLAYALEPNRRIKACIRECVPTLHTTARSTISRAPLVISASEAPPVESHGGYTAAYTHSDDAERDAITECQACGYEYPTAQFHSTAHSSVCAAPTEA